MLQITNNNYKYNASPLKNNVVFGRANSAIDLIDTDMSAEEKAEKIRELTDKISNSDKGPSALRSFLVISGLTAAAALTAATISGRFFKLFEGLGLFNKLSPKISQGIESVNSKLNGVEPDNTFKGYLIKLSKSFFKALDKTSVYGIEEPLSKLSLEITKKNAALRKKAVKLNPDLKGDKAAIDDAVQKMIQDNEELQNFFKSKTKQKQDLKGDNLSKKATQTTFGTVSALGALKEASRDDDNNGIPDCVEYAGAKKEAAQKVTAAIINCAMDSV